MIDPLRAHDPDAGYYRITAERRFNYLQLDPEHTIRVVWQALPVTCPMCGADTGLTFVLERAAQPVVEVLCPNRHEWPEHLVDPGHFTAWADMRWTTPNFDMFWILEAGFGEEPPPPIDYAKEIPQAARIITKVYVREAKKRVRRQVRRRVRKVKKKALNVAYAPVAAVIRAAWAMQAGIPPEAPAPGEKKDKQAPGPKIPAYAKYRAAYGIPAPAKGPACLVCEDRGRIVAPGLDITCTECEGPAAAALAAAERKAARARAGGRASEGGKSRPGREEAAGTGGAPGKARPDDAVTSADV
ncbi:MULTISPECIES: hypothetical protein [unclassified Streptomyces]|uniref:hypothetical protein n=1 Tax=unclassified Streptomyces TaxID=2593676 RepID=UPI001BE6096D|nr:MULTISPECIES: hypothetical protein [unclassified Streptomyces]MBT2406866.1 hypothetical protein [Streptomyces sp. ISL-21]MBT2612957.1 hypothetical protein [Streptomyces sp. ISL-87]